VITLALSLRDPTTAPPAAVAHGTGLQTAAGPPHHPGGKSCPQTPRSGAQELRPDKSELRLRAPESEGEENDRPDHWNLPLVAFARLLHVLPASFRVKLGKTKGRLSAPLHLRMAGIRSKARSKNASGHYSPADPGLRALLPVCYRTTGRREASVPLPGGEGLKLQLEEGISPPRRRDCSVSLEPKGS